MNPTGHARSIRPSATGWIEFSKFATPVYRPTKVVAFQVIAGAGEQAIFLDECFRSFVMAEGDAAKELGWQVPPAARIPVMLAGVGDADWSLEGDETKF